MAGAARNAIRSSSESSAGDSRADKIAIGTSIAVVMGAVWRTGTFETHPVFPQWSESGWPDFGQHGWVGAAGTIAAQAKEAESNAKISNRTGKPFSPFASKCATLCIAPGGCKRVAEFQPLKTEGQAAAT